MTTRTATGSTIAATIQPTGPAHAASKRISGNPTNKPIATAMAPARDTRSAPRGDRDLVHGRDALRGHRGDPDDEVAGPTRLQREHRPRGSRLRSRDRCERAVRGPAGLDLRGVSRSLRGEDEPRCSNGL